MIRLISLLFFLTFALQNCHQKSTPFTPSGPVDITLSLPTKEKIQTKVVFSGENHSKGLSGIPSFEFGPNQAMLFFYPEEGPRSFWMPDTYFDLDIFFLDKNLKIIDVERNVAHHPGMQEPPAIARTRVITCRHVLELRADSPLAKKLKIGDMLKWETSPFPEQIKL